MIFRFNLMRKQRPSKTYVLDDGTRIKAQELADKIGIKVGTAKLRLQSSRDPKMVFAEKGEIVGQRYIKRQKTAKDNRPKRTHVEVEEERLINYIMDNKPYYCPMFRLAMAAISTNNI